MESLEENERYFKRIISSKETSGEIGSQPWRQEDQGIGPIS